MNKVANNVYFDNLQLLAKIYTMLGKTNDLKNGNESLGGSFGFQNNNNLTTF